MKRVIATDRPIKHGNLNIRKSVDSLNKLLSLDSLPLTKEHSDEVLGSVKDFMIRVRNGVTEVLADIPNQIDLSGKGFSLQFSGLLDGETINVDQFKHLALTTNPRDRFTFSESEEGKVEVEEEVKQEPEDKPTEVISEPKLTENQLIQLLENPDVQSRLMQLLSVKPEVEPESKEEVNSESSDKTETKPETIRVVVKPNVAPKPPVTKPKLQMQVKQLSFPTL